MIGNLHDKGIVSTRLRHDVSAAHMWSTVDNGGMITTGIGGAMAGKRVDLLLIDDPVKNHQEAFLKSIRDRHWDWYQSVAYTRLSPDAAVIVIMTRWHEDDLIGRLLGQMAKGEGDHWDVVSLPAIAEDENDALGRKIGEPLWPERFPLEALERIKRAVGSYVWASLYQQRPYASEGVPIRMEGIPPDDVELDST